MKSNHWPEVKLVDRVEGLICNGLKSWLVLDHLIFLVQCVILVVFKIAEMEPPVPDSFSTGDGPRHTKAGSS